MRTRQQWGAKRPKNAGTPAPRRRSKCYLHHSATTGTGDAAMRLVQAAAFSRGFADVSYTRAVDADGTVYEGRSPDIRGAHTDVDTPNGNLNILAHAIVAIGNFQDHRPTRAMVHGIADCLVEMWKRGELTRPRLTGGHRDVKATDCPGKHLYARVGRINRLARRKAKTRRTRKQLIATIRRLRRRIRRLKKD